MKLGKKRRLPLIGALSFGLLLSTVGVLISSNESKLDEVQGYSTSSLPTTIDLNDTSESNIRSYYSSLNNKSTSERQGNNLLKNLKTILKNGQKYYSYDSGNAIWQIYEIADRDWSKSPASSTSYGTYNSSTNKITNYTYGTSSSSSKNNPYIHALYINRNVTNQTTAWDDHQQTQWGINREHVWPKAEGFETSGAGGARGDPMHLMAGNGYANNIHSNYYYGYVNTSSSYTNCGSKYSNVSGNLLGKSKTLGGSTNVFEPQDCDKGDIARAIFYMVARYNYLSSSDSDGIDSNNPNLALTQSLSDWASSGYSSTTSKQGKMGIMTDLLAWHHADPVDEYEIHRNNLLYTNYTNNRNPFIDFPEWADFIWGSVNYSGSTYVSHSTTPTGYATPSSDTINGYNSGGGETISVTGISVSPSSTSVEAGKDVTITPTITPSNATNQGVSWTTSNSSIATVSGGIVTGVAEGSATITATTSDGGYTATCSVTVTASQGGGETSTSYTLDTSSDGTPIATSNSYNSASQSDGYKWALTLGAKQTNSPAGLWLGSNNNATNKAKQKLSNGDFTEATAIASAIGVDTSSQFYTALFQQSGGTKITDVKSVNVSWSGTAGTAPSKLWVVYSTDNGSTWNVFDAVNESPSSSGTSFTTSSAVSSALWGIVFYHSAYGNVKVPVIEFEVDSSGEEEATLSSIAVKTAPTKLTYTVGDGFDANGLVITATYSDSTTADIPYENNEDQFEFDPADNLQTSDVSVTISYGGKTTTQAITVGTTKTLSSITINTDNVTKSFYVDDTFEHDNLVVTAHFSDSSSDVVSSSATVTTPNMSTAGEKTVTVSYTYGGTTKTATYTITVIEGGSSQTGDYTWDLSIASYETPTSAALVTWSSNCCVLTSEQASGKTAANNYLGGDSNARTSSRFYSGNTMRFTPASNYEITSVVFTATSATYATALKNSNWTNATAAVSSSTVTVTPTDGTSEFYAVLTGTTGGTSIVVNYSYTPAATLVSITLDTTNVQTTFTVGDTFSYSGLVVTAHYNDSSSKTVTPTSVTSPNMSTTGNKSVTVTYTEDEVTETADYSITVNSNPSISWTAPTINVYSGSSLSGTDVNSWAVTYNDGAGHQTVLTYSQLTVKLGGTTISIPHTWTADDDGKTLTATYSSLTTSESSAVQVTQTINSVMMEAPASDTTSDLTFTAACGGSGTADDGKAWTVTSDAAESNFDSTKGIHYGTGKLAVEYIQLVSDSFTSGTITEVVVNASGASGVTGSISVTVGGNAFGEVQSFNDSADNKTFTGSASAGQIVVRIYKAAAAVKAIYCKSVVVTYSTSSSSVDIANNVSHISAQRAVVKFAKAFNAAMDTTNSCTTNMSSAWSTATSAWNTFLSEASALGQEEAYAKNLIKYATSQWTEGTDSDYSYCLERCVRTYEECVNVHGQTAFMNDVRQLGAPSVSPMAIISNTTSFNIALIIVVVSLVAASAIGGYFYLRRREQK